MNTSIEVYLFVSYRCLRINGVRRVGRNALMMRIDKVKVEVREPISAGKYNNCVRMFDIKDKSKTADRVLRICDYLSVHRLDMNTKEKETLFDSQTKTLNRSPNIYNHARIEELDMYFERSGPIIIFKDRTYCGLVEVKFKSNFNCDVSGTLANTDRNVIVHGSFVYFLDDKYQLLSIDGGQLNDIVRNDKDIKEFECKVVFSQNSTDISDFTLIDIGRSYREIYMMTNTGTIININNRPNREQERRYNLLQQRDDLQNTMFSCIISYPESPLKRTNHSFQKSKLLTSQFSLDSDNNYSQTYRLLSTHPAIRLKSTLNLKAEEPTDIVHSMRHVYSRYVHYIICTHSSKRFDLIADYYNTLVTVKSSCSISNYCNWSLYTYINDRKIDRRTKWAVNKDSEIHMIVGTMNGLYDVCIEGL